MGFAVLLCCLVTAVTTSCSTTHDHSEVRYECGPHGKFEYCIDDVPSCVIGCHCHPGYYFDTDTKICELNTKLMQHSRSHYVAEPIRAYDLPEITPTETTIFPMATATAYSNEKNYDIQKNTDELGDWLYNQFFKTIENQVINNANNTKSSSKVKPPTRRSGASVPVINKLKKRNRKNFRSHRKRKHMKGRRLKKLLRITEDDSLFDSDSDSSYSGSDDSSDYSDSSSDGSTDTSYEKKSSEIESLDDKDHGHKKVIIFNRRPKPPLPSFIFVPGMDTPFYPPIGLPPPPLLPMFPMPMVPAPPPPTMIPLPPLPTTLLTTTPATTSPTTVSTDSSGPPQDDNETTTTTTTNIPDLPDGRRDRLEKPHKRLNLEQFISRVSEPGKHKKLQHAQKNRLMQQLMEKLKIRRTNYLSSPDVKSLEDFQDQDLQDTDDLQNLLEFYTSHKRSHKQDQKINQIPELEDVDFKYLSELIHRVNTSTATTSLPFDHNDDLTKLQKLQFARPSRRNFRSHYPRTQINRQRTDDIYYSNLGRQMASLILNVDSDGYPQFNKFLEHKNRQVPYHSVLNENRDFPRSLWERSVRSLLPQQRPLSEYLDERRTLKHSNEKSLINLENEFEIVASTPPPLSLQELENIFNTMQKAHAHIKFHHPQPMKSTKRSIVNLNVNLLPKPVSPATPYNRLFKAPEKVEYQTQLPRVYLGTYPEVAVVENVFHEPEKKNHVSYSGYLASLNVNLLPKHVRLDASSSSTIFDDPKKVQYQTQLPGVYLETSPGVVANNTSVFQEPKKKNHVPYNDYLTRLNVNLLPKYVRPASSYSILFNTQEKKEYQTQLPRSYSELTPGVVTNNTSAFHEPEKNNHVPYSDYWLSNLNVKPIQPIARPRSAVGQISKPDNLTYNTIYPISQTVSDVVQTKPTETNKPRRQYLQFLDNVPFVKQIIPKLHEPKVKYKSLNYISGKKHYMYEATSYPYLLPFRPKVSKKNNKTPYINRNLHQFQYFN